MSDNVSRRRQDSPTKLADLPHELLVEILLRLPPQPHCLLVVSEACPTWRRLVTDPEFLRRFRAHHGDTPPLIGVFHNNFVDGVDRFIPTGDNPAGGIFDCQMSWLFLDCRHGRALLHNALRSVLILWDPINRSCSTIRMPQAWTVASSFNAAVMCAAGDDDEGHHRDCHSSAFHVVLVLRVPALVVVSVYSSETGQWNKWMTALNFPPWIELLSEPCAVVGNTLYQPLSAGHILSYNLDSKILALVPHPPEDEVKNVRIMRLDDGVLGFSAAREDFSLRLWAREAGEGWVLRKTVQLDKLLPLSAVLLPETDIQSPFDNISPVKILGASEYDSVIFLWTMFGNFMLNLGSMKLKKLCDHTKRLDTVYPYESFYAPGHGPTTKIKWWR